MTPCAYKDVIGGSATTVDGLHDTALVYSAAVAVLTTAAAVR